MRFGNIWKYHKLPSPRTCWHFGWWKNHLKHQSRIEETKTSDEKKQLDTLCKTPIQNGCLEFSISLWYFRWTQEQGSLYYQPKQYIRQFNDAISGWCYPNLPISRIQLPTETAFLGGFNITSTRPCQFCRKKTSTVLRRVAILQRLWVPQTAIPKSHKGSASKKFNASWGSRIWLFFVCWWVTWWSFLKNNLILGKGKHLQAISMLLVVVKVKISSTSGLPC